MSTSWSIYPDGAQRAVRDALGRADVDLTPPEEFARRLALETERSLAQDPSRWRWVSSLTRDVHRSKPEPMARRAG
jgi:hypothetical protein